MAAGLSLRHPGVWTARNPQPAGPLPGGVQDAATSQAVREFPDTLDHLLSGEGMGDAPNLALPPLRAADARLTVFRRNHPTRKVVWPSWKVSLMGLFPKARPAQITPPCKLRNHLLCGLSSFPSGWRAAVLLKSRWSKRQGGVAGGSPQRGPH